jgi:hypothetical protein
MTIAQRFNAGCGRSGKQVPKGRLKTMQMLYGIRLSALAILLAAWPILAAVEQDPSVPKAAVFYDNLPGLDQAFALDIAAQVRAAGYAPELVYAPVLTNQALLTTKRYDLLVLPNARTLPIAAAPTIEAFLRSGGDLLALGLPAWQTPVFQANGKWLTRESYEEALAAQRQQNTIEDFDHANLSRWTRSSGDSTAKAKYELANGDHGKALHVTVTHLVGWDTLASPALSHPFPTNHTLTCFRAKGGPHTRQLAVEWLEEDGSRWIATVDLTQQWKNYALPPDRFKPWPADSVDENRRFNPAKAVSCSVGISQSHTAPEGDGHEYWFDDLGTATNPFGDVTPPAESDVPVLDSLSPSYQCFPITTPVVVRADHQKVPLEAWEKTAAKADRRDALSCLGLNPRVRGVGFDQGRSYRWEPLLGAYDAETQDYRGALAALLVNTTKPPSRSVWAVFTPADMAFYRQPAVSNCLHQVLSRMKRGVFLGEGGSEFFTLFADQQFQVGARVVNYGKQEVNNLSLTITLLDAEGRSPRAVLETNFTLAPGETRTFAQDKLTKQPDEDTVSVALTIGGTPIDGLRHELGVWQPETKPDFIKARQAGFWLGGKPWKAHGVNYMPSSGIGLANHQHFEYWLGHGAYDPEVIERDLRRVKAMNLNAVSVFIYHDSLQAQHLLDFLRRCEALGLHVNLSLRPGSPMTFSWDQMKEIIEFYRLAQNDTVLAYDIAWEPTHGGHAEQQRDYAGLWHQWVLQRYDSIATATNAWGFPAPRLIATPRTTLTPLSMSFATLSIDVPAMSQLITDGPWRKMIADYRIFLDEILHNRYSAARQLIQSIDPNHAVSFRMSSAGDPLYNLDVFLPYDFYGLAQAVDIWEPEAYDLIGDWERIRAGDFTAAYARLCNAEKPLLWAEMGYSVWDMTRMAPDPQKLTLEARYYTDFYRMMIESGADGVFFWWYPGGLRYGENSDFGIINPDGTDRPVTQVIRTEGPRFLKAPKPAAPSEWITVNRDRDARGLYGIYQAAQERFWKAMEVQRRPGLRYERQQDSTK